MSKIHCEISQSEMFIEQHKLACVIGRFRYIKIQHDSES